MGTYIQTGIGILISVGLFLIGYRQTIGAKKERVVNANYAIGRIVLRRMVLEDYVPTIKSLERLLEGKAREFRVSTTDLFSVGEVLNSLFTTIFDNELITPTQREQIEKRIEDLLSEVDRRSYRPSSLEVLEISAERRQKRYILAYIAITASVIGSLATLLPKFSETGTINREWIYSGLLAVIINLVLVGIISVWRRSKEVTPPSVKYENLIRHTKLEADVAKALKKAGLDYIYEPYIGRYSPDFMLLMNGKTIAIEVVNSNALTGGLRSRLAHLEEMRATSNIDFILLVSKAKVDVPAETFFNDRFRVVPISDLIAEIRRLSKDTNIKSSRDASAN